MLGKDIQYLLDRRLAGLQRIVVRGQSPRVPSGNRNFFQNAGPRGESSLAVSTAKVYPVPNAGADNASNNV